MASRKGIPNKVSTEAKGNILAVFHRIGGIQGMEKWARENQTDFYRIYAKLVPQAVDVDAKLGGHDGGPITVNLNFK